MISQIRLFAYGLTGLFIVCLMLALASEKRHSRKLTERNVVLTQKLDELAAKSKERQAETGKVITRYIKAQPEIERRVQIIEKAPLPGQCATPKEVLQADI